MLTRMTRLSFEVDELMNANWGMVATINKANRRPGADRGNARRAVRYTSSRLRQAEREREPAPDMQREVRADERKRTRAVQHQVLVAGVERVAQVGVRVLLVERSKSPWSMPAVNRPTRK